MNICKYFKSTWFLIFGSIVLSSCGPTRKDIIETMQEPVVSRTEIKTVSESKQIVSPLIETTQEVFIEQTQYKKFDIPGIDLSKKVQFSFKDEDIGRLLEFLSKISGITIVNIGSEVSTQLLTDPQSTSQAQQLLQQQQQYYGGQQQQQKQETSKKIGPVSGKVTIYSKGMVTLELAFKILDTVLLGKGYTSVLVGDVLKIVPITGIRQINLKVVVNSDPKIAPDGDDIVVQIVLLKNLTASKLRTDFASLIPSWGLILSNEAANALILINSLSNIKTMLQIIDNLDKAATRAVGVAIYELKYAGAKTLAAVLNEVFRGITSKEGQQTVQQQQYRQQYLAGRSMPQEAEEQITIVSDDRSNSIVAVASPQTLSLVKATIEQLDKMEKQVLIEVLVIDVTLNKDFQLGIEWTFPASPVKLDTMEFSSGTLKSDLQLSDKIPSFSYTLLKDQTKVLIHNLMKETKVDVKAAPRILTLDNQKAIINVGQDVPTLTGSQTTNTGQVIYTYKYDKVGVILEVTPHINMDDYISMSVKQTVSKITETTYFGAPVLDNREASTSVRVKDSETMVLGGIITDKSSVTENKIPLLGDIPLLGFLFKSEQRISEKTELLLFLTPHIITSAKSAGETIKKLDEKIEKVK
ncbi:MAG: secretin N-terminal domain-containing protein [Candidatus Firestonebacteria bacterium]